MMRVETVRNYSLGLALQMLGYRPDRGHVDLMRIVFLASREGAETSVLKPFVVRHLPGSGGIYSHPLIRINGPEGWP